MSGTPPPTPSARQPLHCDRCGDLLGVYEPLVALEGDVTRGTSLAAERHAPPGAIYRHRTCHAGDDGAGAPEDSGAAA